MRIKNSIFIVWFIVFVFTASIASGQGNDIFTELPGSIAYIGADYNVYNLSLEDGTQIQLTDDANVQQNPVRYYRWPTWSTDGRLAYFLSVVGADNRGAINFSQTDAFVSVNGTVPGVQIYSGADQVFQYAYWSPQDCMPEAACRDLALLLSSPNGLFVEMLRMAAGETIGYAIEGNGGPFYYSWSPDGTRLFRRRAANTPLDVFDVTDKTILEELSQNPGVFQAPAWSPVDDRLLFGAANTANQSTDLMILGLGETQTLVSNLRGSVAFSWSPNGNYIAYTNQQGPLLIVDAVTGDVVARSPVSGALAFFWSPDSQKLAYITLDAVTPSIDTIKNPNSAKAVFRTQNTDNEISIAWSVLNVNNSELKRYGAFRPTGEMLYMLQYFDQFAQSHRIWSPDSTHLVYGQIADGNRAVISILDTTSADSVPLVIATGFIGIWSFD